MMERYASLGVIWPRWVDRFLGDIAIIQGLTVPMMLESTGHFLAAESCNLIIGLRSAIPFLTKVKARSTFVYQPLLEF